MRYNIIRKKHGEKRMNLTIYTLTHKHFEVPSDKTYQPLQVGREGKDDLGYLCDNTGDNISALNCYYSELTGLYWIWKNVSDIDYVGTCHYRRYLINDKEQVFTKQEYLELLKEYDLITTKRVLLNNSYHYGFSANHNILALDTTGEVIRDIYPEYYDTFIRLVNGPETYFGNILVTSKKLYDEYAEWLFTIFKEVEKRINLDTDEDAYHKRVLGFISEFLLFVWVTVKDLKVCECKVGMIGEKAETREMKEQLAYFFERREIEQAKEYFMKKQKERPDVLMEASDITGELRLCMQIIATADQEMKRYGKSILDRENQFRELITLFTQLNKVVSHTRTNHMSKEDRAFIQHQKMSEIAWQIAVMILPAEAAEKERILAALQKEMI